MGYLKGQILSLVSMYLNLWMWFCQCVFGTQIPQPPERLLNWLFNHNHLHTLEFLADVYFPYGIFRFQNRLYLLDPKLSLKAGHKLGKGASDYLFNSPLKSSVLNIAEKAPHFRQMIAASFRKSRMEEKRAVMQEVIEKAVSKMAQMDIVNMSNFTLKVSLDIIGHVLFEIDLEALEGKQEPLQRAMDTVFYRCCALGQLSFDSQEFVESGKTIQSVAASILNDCLDQSKEEQSFVQLLYKSGSPEESDLRIFLWVIQRSHHLWHDSKSYCPGRFRMSSPTNQSRSWFPFGAGPRMCPAQHLAWVELSLMMTYFLHHFNFRRVSQTRDLDVCVDWEHTVLYPKCHVILGVQKRSH